MSRRKLELGKEFCTAYNPDKYLIFVSGRLLNKANYEILIPSPYNNYSKKVIYFFCNIPDNAQIDVYYIESDDNFDTVPFNRDIRIYTKTLYCEWYLQNIVKIPYPYQEYPRDEHAFFVMDGQGRYMDKQKDYVVSIDGEFITLRNERRMKEVDVDKIIFGFPYIYSDWESNEYKNDLKDHSGTDSGITFVTKYSVSGNTSNGIVTFQTKDANYHFNKENMVLFGDSTFIHPSRYELLDINKIQMIGDYDKSVCDNVKYTMVIFQENDINHAELNQFKVEVINVKATKEKQRIFDVPKNIKDRENFIVFRGSVLLSNMYRYKVNRNDNTLELLNSNDFLVKNRSLTFVFLENATTSNFRKIKMSKIELVTTSITSFLIPPFFHNHMNFNYENLILFLNGTYLQPDHYIIENNIVKVQGVEELDVPDKQITGIFFDSVPDDVEDEEKTKAEYPSFEYINLRDDHDFVWLEEAHATAKSF